MADQYWKFVCGAVTPAKVAQIQTLIATSKPSDSTIITVQYGGGSVCTIAFGGGDVTATKAWIQSAIITPLSLLTTSNQAIAVGDICKTAADSQ